MSESILSRGHNWRGPYAVEWWRGGERVKAEPVRNRKIAENRVSLIAKHERQRGSSVEGSHVKGYRIVPRGAEVATELRIVSGEAAHV